MDMLGRVRRMHMRDKLSISEIAKRTGLSRNTVKKWLRAPGDVEPTYRRKPDQTKLKPFESFLVAALKADSLRRALSSNGTENSLKRPRWAFRHSGTALAPAIQLLDR